MIIGQATEEHPRHSEGSMVRLSDGRLLVAWTRFGGGGQDDAPAHIVAATSDVKGESWSEPWVLHENVAKKNVMSQSFLRLHDGTLLSAALHKDGEDSCVVHAYRCTEEPHTWSEPQPVSSRPGYHVMNNDRLVQLSFTHPTSPGRILAPVSYCRPLGEPFTVHVLYSDDNGTTWAASAGDITAPKRGAMEPGIIERKDGSLMMIIRTQTGTICRSLTDDAGANWCAAESMGVAAPEAPSTVGRLPDGRLALVHNPDVVEGAGHLGPRTPLWVSLSDDEGETWEPWKPVETDASSTYAYCSWYAAGDFVFLTYYVRDEETGRICQKITRLRTEWFAERE